MTVFKPLQYTENSQDHTFQRVERHVVGDQVVEQLGSVYRVATPRDQERTDSVVIYDPEGFGFRRLVPIQQEN